MTNLIEISPQVREFAGRSAGARVKYQGNVLCCSFHRTFAENLEACLAALVFLTGESIEDIQEYVTIDAYRSYGKSTEV